MRTLIVLIAMLCAFAAANAEEAAPPQQLLTPELDRLYRAGSDALMNMNYADAETSFREMIRIAPKHPAGHIYMANTIWLGHLAALRRLQTNVYNRGNTFFSKKEDAADPAIEKAFKTHMDKGIALSEAILKRNKNDAAGLYYLGVAKNISAGFQATVRRSFFAALRNGSKGVDLHRDLLKKNPNLIDAKLSLGMYNYIVGSLPMAVKILVFLGGVRGSRKDGLRTVEAVAANGNYAKDEASVLLVMLYSREKQPESSLKVLEYLTKEYPSNTLFRLEMAMTLAQLERYPQSFEMFESLIRNQKAYAYMPDLIHYQYGVTLADAGEWNRAQQQFRIATTSSKAPPALVSLAHLQAGRCFDAAGNRQQAIAEYQTVLKRPDAFDSHEKAKDYLDEPFEPEN